MKTEKCESRRNSALSRINLPSPIEIRIQLRRLKSVPSTHIRKPQIRTSPLVGSLSATIALTLLYGLLVILPVSSVRSGTSRGLHSLRAADDSTAVILEDKRAAEARNLPLCSGSPFFGILMLPCRIGDGKWHKFQEREEAEGEGAVEAEDEDEGSQAGASPVGQSLRLMEPATDLGWMPMTKRKGGVKGTENLLWQLMRKKDMDVSDLYSMCLGECKGALGTHDQCHSPCSRFALTKRTMKGPVSDIDQSRLWK